jgi:hypothetical protein
MSKIELVWKWLDGKKTVFGAILLFAAGFPHLESWIGVEFVDLLYYCGTGLSGVGIFHKIVKK